MINNVVLMGRIVYPLELKSTQTGISVVRFRIAVDRTYQKGAERKADFIDCEAWRQTAEFLHRNFGKGDMVALTGEIQTDSYTDKDGNRRNKVAVVVNNVSFCGGKENASERASQPELSVSREETKYEEEIIDDTDDLPF